MKTMQSLELLCVLALLAMPGMARAPEQFSPPSRTFDFTYQVTLKDLPAGAHHVRVWIPRAINDANQTVALKKVDSPVHLRETHESAYGNHILYGEIPNPQPGATEIKVEYEVTRKEYSRGDLTGLERSGLPTAGAPKNLDRFLRPDRLVPVDGKIKAMADEITQGKHGSVKKAHAIYNYVFQTLRYDKSGTGWGRGDTLWVCDAKHGNCTDFHSLFISLARAAGIPARFEIGFPVPSGTEGTIPGYHCWAEFYVVGLGWVPVDISEAWKDPKKRDYFFGAVDANRVQFTVGRDLTLKPQQAGNPLNYFIYPYVEVDGKPFEGVGKKFTYQEASAHGAGAVGGR